VAILFKESVFSDKVVATGEEYLFDQQFFSVKREMEVKNICELQIH